MLSLDHIENDRLARTHSAGPATVDDLADATHDRAVFPADPPCAAETQPVFAADRVWDRLLDAATTLGPARQLTVLCELAELLNYDRQEFVQAIVKRHEDAAAAMRRESAERAAEEPERWDGMS